MKGGVGWRGKVHKGKTKMRKIRNICKKGSAIDEGDGEVKMVKIKGGTYKLQCLG